MDIKQDFGLHHLLNTRYHGRMPPSVLILLCHPAKDSFNRRIAATAFDAAQAGGAEVHLRDLYAEKFDPVLTDDELNRRYSFDESVQGQTKDLRAADVLVFVHPDWWGGPPAVLKGWIERVLRPGVAYDYVGEEFEGKRHVGLLGDKSAAVFCTSDSSNTMPIWSDSIFPFCGITRFHVEVFPDIRNSRLRQRRKWISRVEEVVHGFVSVD